MHVLRSRVNDALLDLVHDDPLSAWESIPVLELSGSLDGRLAAVLAALGQAVSWPGVNARMSCREAF
ncbi:hypothetical protein [Nonomuraea sp. NPDC049607]|uniref:hypothetical protein n=1 Tax=Nonomuraea sp. NPDC049607 TaxID=3154732 RepID=UPI00341AB3DC